DTFDFKRIPSIKETLIRELLTGEYLDRHENLLLVGNSGSGPPDTAVSSKTGSRRWRGIANFRHFQISFFKFSR
ncbi:MAG: ATP-binding protein, partial [Phycisphaerae bacterium]